MEVWKPIEGFSDYEISNFGRVKSLKKGKGARAIDGILKQAQHPEGYMMVNLCQNKKQHSQKVHRLVGKAFLENPHSYDEIDHINRDPSDNKVENLRWANRSQQCLNTSRQDREYLHIGFRVSISRKDLGIKFDKTYKTLEEAIEARDKFLISLNQSSSENTHQSNDSAQGSDSL